MIRFVSVTFLIVLTVSQLASCRRVSTSFDGGDEAEDAGDEDGRDEQEPPRPDAGTGNDAGTNGDAGSSLDAGTDAGTGNDAGAGAGTDAGAGTGTDAGTEDAGESEDAGTDAGESEDAGTNGDAGTGGSETGLPSMAFLDGPPGWAFTSGSCSGTQNPRQELRIGLVDGAGSQVSAQEAVAVALYATGPGVVEFYTSTTCSGAPVGMIQIPASTGAPADVRVYLKISATGTYTVVANASPTVANDDEQVIEAD